MTEKQFKNIGDEIHLNGEVWCVAGGKHCADVIATALNELLDKNEQLKQYNQQITKVLEDGGVILTKNQLNSLITMKNDDSVEVRHLKTVNAKLKDEIRALREYIQKKELKE